MFPTFENSLSLLKNLSETYEVEVKRWFDPHQLEYQAKLIKALMALRNNDGGRLVIGFDDKSMKPVSDGRPASVRDVFIQDDVQGWITKFSSEPFEVLIQYIELNGAEFPVICVPSGIVTPVVTKTELKSTTQEKILIPIHAIFVRTLSSNNTVSTAIARYQDWPRLMEKCFDNREADIGRFVRRHLSENNLSILTALLKERALQKKDTSTMCAEWLDEGYSNFKRAISKNEVKLPTTGYFEIAALIVGDLIDELATNMSMLNLIKSANRHLTGWPIFVTLNTDKQDWRPTAIEDGWETLCICTEGGKSEFKNVDFWRIQPDGKFYAIRGYPEDVDERLGFKGERKLIIEFVTQNVIDGIAETLSIAKQMVKQSSEASLVITLRWSDLKGRCLSYTRPGSLWAYLGGRSEDDSANSSITLPLDIPDSSLSEHVSRALAPFFRKFQGFEVDQAFYDGEVQRILRKQ